MTRLVAERLIEDMTPAERDRAAIVEAILPSVREHAADADARGEFPEAHLTAFRESGLLGLVVPTEYGGLGGSLRDLAATTYALGTACGSTALAYFFHCSSSSRGLLPLGAIEAGLYDEADVPVVRAFAEKVLNRMGREGLWIGNFASEAVKASNANVLIQTTATRTEKGWLLNGVKSFGCLTGSADYYLVTARREDIDGMEGLSLFLVDRRGEGVRNRQVWNGLGMRASANHGIVMEDCFVAEDEALTIPGGFMTATKVARGSWVGNQVAIATIYAGIARGAYEYALDRTMGQKFADTGKPIASSPMHQVMIGNAEVKLEEAHLWARRQVLLETADPEILTKPEVVRMWRESKGAICERSHDVVIEALKMCGTSGAVMDNVIGRSLRDVAMGLVQAFPAERGKLDLAKMIVDGHGADGFTTIDKNKPAT
jgi:alkylation response protein AidB-like acyl-CoA dehydrogenase